METVRFARVVAGLAALAPALVLLACHPERPPVAGPPVAAAEPPREGLDVDDVFDVRVFDEPEFTATFRVAVDGTIDYPHVGRIQVVGMRESDLQRLIADKLREGKILKDPQVSVFVKERQMPRVTVLGQVAKPGPVPFIANMTIVDAIAAAGGFTPIASKNSVTLSRSAEGKVTTARYAVQDISEGRAPNVTLQPRDIVVVDERLF